jgi:gluconolactonase
MPIFAQDMGFPEAPVRLPDGTFLFTEMSPDKGWITRVSKDGRSRTVVATTGRPNGLALDRHGVVWVAETAQRAVLRMTQEGDIQTFASDCRGEPFLFLNDLAFSPDGDLYVTDSGVALDEFAPGGEMTSRFRDLVYDGRVYRCETGTGSVEIVDRGLEFTNGLAFGPDGALYIAETLTGNIYRYEYSDGRVTGERELFGNVIENFEPEVPKGPDGMKFGADGNLYVAVFGQGDVTVLDRGGDVLRRIPVDGSLPTNLLFAPKGEARFYLTEAETGTVQIFDAGTDGFELYG